MPQPTCGAKTGAATTDPRLARLQAQANAVIGTVRLARELVRGQRAIDLTGLDNGIGALCAQALDLQPDSARALLPLLTALADSIATLEAAIAEQRA